MDTKTEIVEKRVKSTIIRRRAKVETPSADQTPKEESALLASKETVSPSESSGVGHEGKTLLPSSHAATQAQTHGKSGVIEKSDKSSVSKIPGIAEPTEGPAKKVSITPPTDDERPRYGLKVVGQIAMKPSGREITGKTPAKTEVKAPSELKKVIPSATPAPVSLRPLTPTEEDELAKKGKLKKVAKKGKREELEVDIDGIGKVATLTQLTRLASAIVPERVERERVFEPTRSQRKRKGFIKREGKKTEITIKKAAKRVIKMGENIVVGQLAHELGIKSGEIIKRLMDLGSMVTVNQSVDFDTATLIATEYGYEIKKTSFQESQAFTQGEDKPEDLKPRPPVVTVMGHVDHGKTSLLDAIRKTQVAVGEAGGITQHIGAYQVKVSKGLITFLDTPGHEAFTAMRARGASVTDIVVLVVAADDGVMPQTAEAIHHAKAAEVPIIVAINKIDKPDAEPERVKRQLMEHQLISEELGGDTIFANVSAKQGTGIEELLELILLQAEVLELKANPNKPAKGIVIESRLDRGRGPVASVLVQEGTLRVGDCLILGTHTGRVRAMNDDQGREVKEAIPAQPVELIGLSGVPNAGQEIAVVSQEGMAKLIAEHRGEKERATRLASAVKVNLEDLFNQIQKGETRELRIVLKGDVQGSVEAIRESLDKLATQKVKVTILHSGAGGITESDVMLASASNAIVIGFNVRPDVKARDIAASEKVEIKVYDIIYNVIDDIKKAMEGLLEPTYKEKYLGRAEVRNTFNISKVGTIAGCFVQDGVIQRAAKIRLLRDNVIVYNGKLSSLKRFKDDAREVSQGFECGLGLENFNDIKVGDVIEAYTIETIATKL